MVFAGLRRTRGGERKQQGSKTRKRAQSGYLRRSQRGCIRPLPV
jgi:hypothetical protein